MRSAARFQSKTRPSGPTAKAPSPAVASACSKDLGSDAPALTGATLERPPPIAPPPEENTHVRRHSQVACLGEDRAAEPLFKGLRPGASASGEGCSWRPRPTGAPIS